jgi:hypothetical protein
MRKLLRPCVPERTKRTSKKDYNEASQVDKHQNLKHWIEKDVPEMGTKTARHGAERVLESHT